MKSLSIAILLVLSSAAQAGVPCNYLNLAECQRFSQFCRTAKPGCETTDFSNHLNTYMCRMQHNEQSCDVMQGPASCQWTTGGCEERY